MATFARYSKLSLHAVLGAIVTIVSLTPVTLYAQQLEEVVVTAQRREQSLQEVPISIQAITSAEIQRQGFRNMEDLAVYSPAVYVLQGVQNQDVTIRGFGTIGNSLALEQAAPLFVDGIHYGRQSQISTAFLDVDRVEVLEGPQPVYFGMNTTAGAFNIVTKKPTPTWEGDFNGKMGNNGTHEVTFGVGGPITDTLGIRVAGKDSHSDGFMKNAITGKMLPRYNELGGRVSLQWKPLDNLTVDGRIEGSKLRNGSEAELACLTGGNLLFTRKGVEHPSAIGDERSVWGTPPNGTSFSTPHLPISTDCFKGDVAASNEGPYMTPPDNIHEENSDFGSIDIRDAANGFSTTPGQGIVGDGSIGGIQGHDYTDSWTGALHINYVLGNGIQIDSTTGYSRYKRDDVKDNCDCPFLMNFQGREEKFNQWSSELRFSSPTGGMFEWMVGFQIQASSMDDTSSSLRANVRRGQRFNKLWQDALWKNVFATITYNFLDNKASLDIGGRYSSTHKEFYEEGYGAAWIFNVEPVSAGTAGVDYFKVDPADARIYVDAGEVDTSNLWTLGYNNTRTTPTEWLPSQASAVGLTMPDYSVRNGPVSDTFTQGYFDPQISLRYRPTPNHSLFFRWAKASKAAGYDTGQTTIPVLEDLKFNAEHVQDFELGAKGFLFDNRVRYNLTLFRETFTDLQLSSLTTFSTNISGGGRSVALNAGKQRVQGIEFGIEAAATDQLRLGLDGAIMDGKMLDFAGAACNNQELFNAKYDYGIAGLAGCDPDTELIDRSGQQAARTPDWKFVFTGNYWVPVASNYKVMVNAKGYISAGYITDREGFGKVVKYNTPNGDMNIDVGFGNQDDTWAIMAYAHNIFENRPSYNAQYDLLSPGFVTAQVTKSNFMTYGVQFKYNYR